MLFTGLELPQFSAGFVGALCKKAEQVADIWACVPCPTATISRRHLLNSSGGGAGYCISLLSGAGCGHDRTARVWVAAQADSRKGRLIENSLMLFVICLFRHGGFGLKFRGLFRGLLNECGRGFIVRGLLRGDPFGQHLVVVMEAENDQQRDGAAV